MFGPVCNCNLSSNVFFFRLLCASSRSPAFNPQMYKVLGEGLDDDHLGWRYRRIAHYRQPIKGKIFSWYCYTANKKLKRGGHPPDPSSHPANLGAEIDWAKWPSYTQAPNDNDADENVIFVNNVDAMISSSKYETYLVWECNSDSATNSGLLRTLLLVK